jgi:NADH dehydrogenase FAD-containing subunit
MTGKGQGGERIVVIGAGYAGLAAAARAGRKRRVTLIAPEERFANRVRLHELSAGRAGHQPTIAHVLRGRNVTHIRARVTELDLAGRKVFTDGGPGGEGEAIGYDTLVYALGSRTAWRRAGGEAANEVPGAREHAYAMERAEELSERLRRPDDGTVAVVGGGATGIELAAEIAEAHPNRRVTILSAGQVGGWFSAKGRAIVRENLERLGVVVRENSEVTAVDETGLSTVSGRVEADIAVWAASIEVGPLAKESGLAVDERGEALVDEYLRSVSHPEVYVVGDAAALNLPDIGRVRKGCVSAEPMGRYVGNTLAVGRARRPFRFRFLLQCLSLGRDSGLLQLVTRDDAMTERAYGGLVGRATKSAIVWYIVTALR